MLNSITLLLTASFFQVVAVALVGQIHMLACSLSAPEENESDVLFSGFLVVVPRALQGKVLSPPPHNGPGRPDTVAVFLSSSSFGASGADHMSRGLDPLLTLLLTDASHSAVRKQAADTSVLSLLMHLDDVG